MENKKRNKVKIEINENRDFKGVWIPKKIWLDENLIWTEKILLVEINSLDNEKGCYAGNEHFSKFFGISKDRVSKLISSLKNKDYIKTKLFYKEGTREVEKRLIIVNRSKFYENNEDRTYSYEKLEGIVSDNHNPIVEKAKDINTLNINTINNKDIVQQVERVDEMKSIFEEWWNVYDKKDGKKQAFKKFENAVKEFSYDILMKSTLEYVYQFEKGFKSKQYQKNPVTFLNQYHPDNDYKQSFNYKEDKNQDQKQDAMSMMLEQLNFGGYENEPVNEPRLDKLLISKDVSAL